MPWHPVASLVTLAAAAFLFWTNWADAETGRPALFATGAQIVAAAAYYRLVIRRRGAWTAHIPD